MMTKEEWLRASTQLREYRDSYYLRSVGKKGKNSTEFLDSIISQAFSFIESNSEIFNLLISEDEDPMAGGFRLDEFRSHKYFVNEISELIDNVERTIESF